ncbi:arylamine N-acetyltransferase [Saliphagus sp. GCM10025334]
MELEQYYQRIGFNPDRALDANLETIAGLQQAHVTSVPFDNLSIVGSPFNDWVGEGLSMRLSDIYDKLVDHRRGGLCYDHNGLFGWALSELGMDVTRIAGRVYDRDTGELYSRESHLSLLVALEQPFVVDVGFGDVIRQPLPIDGTPISTVDGSWRVIESERADADFVVQSQAHAEPSWTSRYLFRTTPQSMTDFELDGVYHETHPDAPFNDDPVVSVATEAGRKTLSTATLTIDKGGTIERFPVSRKEWSDVLEREFDIHLGKTHRTSSSDDR